MRPGARPASTSPSSVPAAGSRPASSAQPAGGGSNAWRVSTNSRARPRERRVQLAARRREPHRRHVRPRCDLLDATATGVDDDVVRQITSAPSIVPASDAQPGARGPGSRATTRTRRERPHQRQHAQVRAGLHARPDHGEHRGVFARERARGESRGRRGTQRR